MPQNTSITTPSNSQPKQSIAVFAVKKRNSGVMTDPEVINVLKEMKIEKNEIEILRVQFLKFDDKNIGTIQNFEVDDILSNFDFKFNSKEIKKRVGEECDKNKWKRVNFPQLCQIFLTIQKQEKDEQEQEDLEYIDAFVAMGGNPDKTGVIKKEKLIDVIKNEFELTIDIEELIEKSLANCEDLNFQDFCQMFESGGEEIKSKVSLISEVSERRQTTANLSQTNFNVRYKDFVKWDQKMEDRF
ncbi:hypothetical protein ABPG74_016816 [Tetrahymena malaccensis]